MAVQLYSTATEYLANEITFQRGSKEDVEKVYVYHASNPNAVPSAQDFLEAELVSAPDPRAEGNKVDILTLIGPGDGAVEALEPGDYQRFVAIETADEFIIRKLDTITVL